MSLERKSTRKKKIFVTLGKAVLSCITRGVAGFLIYASPKRLLRLRHSETPSITWGGPPHGPKLIYPRQARWTLSIMTDPIAQQGGCLPFFPAVLHRSSSCFYDTKREGDRGSEVGEGRGGENSQTMKTQLTLGPALSPLVFGEDGHYDTFFCHSGNVFMLGKKRE